MQSMPVEYESEYPLLRQSIQKLRTAFNACGTTARTGPMNSLKLDYSNRFLRATGKISYCDIAGGILPGAAPSLGQRLRQSIYSC